MNRNRLSTRSDVHQHSQQTATAQQTSTGSMAKIVEVRLIMTVPAMCIQPEQACTRSLACHVESNTIGSTGVSQSICATIILHESGVHVHAIIHMPLTGRWAVRFFL